MRNRKLTLFSTLIVASILLIGCNPTEEVNVIGEIDGVGRKLNLVDTYKTMFTTDMETFDYLATYHSVDSEVLVNLVDGLIEYDVYGILRPSLAERWEVSEDKKVYTFYLRDANWVDFEGNVYDEVTADDFVAGMQHLLDAEGGLEYLLWGVIDNAYEYSLGLITDFSQVGVKAVDEKTLEYHLVDSIPYFLTYLTYNPFLPLHREFFISKGGAFGKTEWSAAQDNGGFGVVGQPSSILYNGAYLMAGYTTQSEIKLVANKNYWDADTVKVKTVKYVFDDGSNTSQTFEDFIKGTYSGMGISNTILETAKSRIPDNLYVADTTAVTFYGAWNLNRKNYQVGSAVSIKKDNEQMKEDTRTAILNKSFRKAVQFAWDRAAFNAQQKGEDLKNSGLRSTLVAPEFVFISDEYTDDTGRNYEAGTIYGDLVEAELKRLDPKFDGNLKDNNDGLYNPERARLFREAAKTELGGLVTFPIHIDIVYYAPNQIQSKQALSFKNNIEEVLGTDFIVVDLMAASTVDDYNNSGYRAETGEQANFDFFWGSGWGPDYGDPLTFLSIFAYGADMMSVIGITFQNDEEADADDIAAYNAVLGDYQTLLDEAAAEINDMTKRFVLFAKLEAYFIDQAVAINFLTQGGNYAATRVIPRTVPYTLFGTDNEKLKHLKVANEILTLEEINKFKAEWATERERQLNALD
jgi:ABC-type oligopeptide transport system substrate-binding subunit